jgi:hypothetical protein
VAFSLAVTLKSRTRESLPLSPRFHTMPEGTFMANSLGLSIAPDKLWQAINPWTFYQNGGQFGLVNIDLGQTPRPDIEQSILDEVGSYGRQLGRIGDALDVLMRHLKPEDLTEEEAKTLEVLEEQLVHIRCVKNREYERK